MLFPFCGCVSHKAMQLVLGKLNGQTKKNSINFYRRVSEVTLGLFWCSFATFWARN